MLARNSLDRARAVACAAAVLVAAGACNDDSNGPDNATLFRETMLVSDATGQGAGAVDPHLVNPWGIAINPGNGFVWVANNHSGTSTVYNADGAVQALVVNIPTATAATGGAPTGIAFNSTTDFVIPNAGPAVFLFAAEDGTISAWNQTTGIGARVVVDRSANDAVYLGLTTIGSKLFAANFKGKVVDMFDQGFAFVSSFTDPNIPDDYAPFNVQNINGQLYVAYAKIDPATGEEAAGAGNGYVSVFTATGTFVKRFASQGTLNAPWAMALAPSTFGTYAGTLLVGNFGDGRINVFNASTGEFMTQLKKGDGQEIVLDGLWGIAVGPNNTLYFAAGIQDEEHGLFGTLGPN